VKRLKPLIRFWDVIDRYISVIYYLLSVLFVLFFRKINTSRYSYSFHGHRQTRFQLCTAAPSIRNEIPVEIRNSPSLASFKKHLETHYFTCAFPLCHHTIFPLATSRASVRLASETYLPGNAQRVENGGVLMMTEASFRAFKLPGKSSRCARVTFWTVGVDWRFRQMAGDG